MTAKPNGWTHREFARALGTAVGTKPAIVSSPGIVLRLAARADQLFRGPKRQAHRRPRRLFLAPQLGDRAQARLPARPVAAARSRPSDGLKRNRRLVPRQGWL